MFFRYIIKGIFLMREIEGGGFLSVYRLREQYVTWDLMKALSKSLQNSKHICNILLRFIT